MADPERTSGVGSRDDVGTADAQHPGSDAPTQTRDDEHDVIRALRTYDRYSFKIRQYSTKAREIFDGRGLASFAALDDEAYCRIALYITRQDGFAHLSLQELIELLNGDAQGAVQISECRAQAWSADILRRATHFVRSAVRMASASRERLGHLCEAMPRIAPNLTRLVGEVIGARFISQAGSMEKFVKMPGSALQILGANEAYKRALKAGGRTPKYGLIYNSDLVQKVEHEHRGTVARKLANKCTLAIRHDFFAKDTSAEFGGDLRQQVVKGLELLQPWS
ncbi:hypothetical protein F4802DRAFT_615486 [Xylaria palmicola]|nr:hypothetical protein F4802DRAFT_615486 [Xylaria palmicola]